MASKQFDKEQVDKSLELYQVLKDLRRENGFLTEEFQKQLDAVTDYLKEYEKVSKEVEKTTKRIKDQNKFLDDTEDIIGSIADKVGKTSKLYKDSENYLKAQKAQLSSIADFTQQIGNEDFSKSAEQAVEAYKKYQKSVASVADRTSFTGKRQEEANIAIARARAEYEQSVSFLGDMGEEGQYVLSTLNGMANQTDKFGASVTATTEEWKAMDAVLSNFSGIPAMGELNTLLKTNIRDTLAWKAAVFALGAALGKAAYDYFGAPVKAAMQVDKERQQNRIDGIKDIAKIETDAKSIPAKIGQEILEQELSANEDIRRLKIESGYAGARAAIQFSSSMQDGAAQFERAAKTALFGNKIGSVGYGAAQLQLAGIGADKIASSMEAASTATGRMPSAKVGADMSIMAERTGASVDNIASISEMFQRMDGVSESTAMNLSEGLRTMAEQANIGLGGLVREIAEASKDALSYQIKSGPALAKQVAYAQSIGVSFSDVAKAGKSMVLNYKDSIKNEMQLSAMLGKSVDLSEVRSKFASGDNKGALAALKAQGLNPADMNMFQQEQLSQALGGMDLNTLQKIATNDGTNVGGLSEGNAKKGNQNFLSKTQSAEATLSSQQASISAKTAIIDAELSKTIGEAYLSDKGYADHQLKQAEAAAAAAKLATAMNDAWLATDAYKKSLSDTAQLDIVSGLKENLMSGLAAVAGGIGTSLLDKMIPSGGLGGKLKGMFAMGGGAAAGGGDTGGDGGGGGADASAAFGPIASVAAQIEAAEPVIKKAKPLGKGLAEFGKGLGSFVTSVGKGFGGAIQAIFQGLAQGIQAFRNPVILKGAAIIAGVIVIIGAAIAGASWMMGKALPTLAEGLLKFNDINGMNLLGVGAGLTALGVGMAAMGAGAVLSGIGNLVGNLFGGGIEDTIKKVQIFSNANINAARVKENANAIVAYSKAMAASGLGSAASGLGNLVGGIADGIAGFFGVKPPLQKMQEFSKLTFDATKIKENAEAFTAFGNAMSSFNGSSGSLSGMLADGVAKFFGIEPPIEKMKAFATADFGDTSKLKANAEAYTLFGNAMSSFKGTAGGLGSVLAQGVADFFGVEPPFSLFQKFAAMEGIDVEKTKKNAEAFTAFGNAMASYSGSGTGFWSSLGKGIMDFFGGGDGDLIAKFREFAALDAGGVTAISTAIGSFNTNLSNFKMEAATNVSEGMSSLANATSTYLTSDRTDSINAFSSAIGTLNSQLTELSGIASMVDSAAFAFSNLASALNTLGSINTAALTKIPWGDMEDFASEGGKFVLASSGQGSFALSKETANHIKELNQKSNKNFDTSILRQNDMVALLAANSVLLEQIMNNTADGKAINLDGKKVNKGLLRTQRGSFGIGR